MSLDSVPLRKRRGLLEFLSKILLSTGLTLARTNLWALNSSRPFNNVTSASWDLLKISLITFDFSASNSFRGTWNNDGPIIKCDVRKCLLQHEQFTKQPKCNSFLSAKLKWNYFLNQFSCIPSYISVSDPPCLDFPPENLLNLLSHPLDWRQLARHCPRGNTELSDITWCHQW